MSCGAHMDWDTEGQGKGDATGGTAKGWPARGEISNGLQHAARQKHLRTASGLSPNVYVC